MEVLIISMLQEPQEATVDLVEGLLVIVMEVLEMGELELLDKDLMVVEEVDSIILVVGVVLVAQVSTPQLDQMEDQAK